MRGQAFRTFSGTFNSIAFAVIGRFGVSHKKPLARAMRLCGKSSRDGPLHCSIGTLTAIILSPREDQFSAWPDDTEGGANGCAEEFGSAPSALSLSLTEL